jgi:triosephosphate isomerase
MNKQIAECPAYFEALKTSVGEVPGRLGANFEIVVAPPSTHLERCAAASRGMGLGLGAQNCGPANSGAFTGEISPVVLKELGCSWVILGHSERRHVFKEDDARVLTRLQAALAAGLNVIFCVGEVLADRRAGNTFKVVENQLSILKANFPENFAKRLVIAYEPVWAIGTGENATPQQAQEVHAAIRGWLSEFGSVAQANETRILYGGSVKPENAAQIFSQPDVDGFLIGNASLDSTTFLNVIKNALKSRS